MKNRGIFSSEHLQNLSIKFDFFVSAQPDQNSIYNISGRLQGQNQTQYPDAYLSVEHITITNELNKPPKYDDGNKSLRIKNKIVS